MVTTIQEIKDKALKEVEISGFEADETITIKLRNLSLMGLVAGGKIPNQLLGTATELFEGKKASKEPDKASISELAQMIDLICKNAMVEPTFEEAGEYLTDNQKMEIFYYTQGGVEALNSFRKVGKNK